MSCAQPPGCVQLSTECEVPSTVLRDATPGDFETLWRIDQECFVEGISYAKQELKQYIKRPRAFTIVEETERGIVGFLIGEGGAKGPGHIITIDVLTASRRSGVGTRLLQAAEERLVAAGCRGVLLEAAVDNESAIRFYHRHGYSVLKVLPRYYLDSIDGLLLGKRLDRALSETKKKASV